MNGVGYVNLSFDHLTDSGHHIRSEWYIMISDVHWPSFSLTHHVTSSVIPVRSLEVMTDVVSVLLIQFNHLRMPSVTGHPIFTGQTGIAQSSLRDNRWCSREHGYHKPQISKSEMKSIGLVHVEQPKILTFRYWPFKNCTTQCNIPLHQSLTFEGVKQLVADFDNDY